jgi:hypothetical protein
MQEIFGVLPIIRAPCNLPQGIGPKRPIDGNIGHRLRLPNCSGYPESLATTFETYLINKT